MKRQAGMPGLAGLSAFAGSLAQSVPHITGVPQGLDYTAEEEEACCTN